jgi:hypothetical protein
MYLVYSKKMKLKMKLLAIIVLLSGFAIAQKTESREAFRIGVRAGANLFNVYDSEGKDFVAENKYGFAAGGFLSIPLNKFVGFQPEVMYSKKGFKATGKTILGAYDFTRTSTYLDIPLQLQVKPIEEVTFLIGPQFSYLLNTKNNFNGNVSSTDQEDINFDNYKKSIFGFVVGADFNYEPLVVGIRGAWDINKSDANGDTSTPRYKNQVLQLTVGFVL